MSSNSTILRSLPVIAAILVFVQPGLSATTLYVDQDAPGPIHDGSSWCQAFLDLRKALAAAEGSGGEVTEIRVAGLARGTREFKAGPRSRMWLLRT